MKTSSIVIENCFGFDGYAASKGMDYDKFLKESLSFSGVAGSSTQAFIDSHRNAVINATKGTNLFPSVKMAQMIIESSWGKGITATQANNYFGIKADTGWKGEKKSFNTPRDGKKVNFFRVYPSAQDSVKDHSKFLIENSRYKKAGVFDAKNPEDQIRAIAKAGYAEAGKYDEAIIKLINAYHLKDLDNGILTSYSAPTSSSKGKSSVTSKKSNFIPISMMVTGLIGLGFFTYLVTKNK